MQSNMEVAGGSNLLQGGEITESVIYKKGKPPSKVMKIQETM